jgi:hypothetical protein
MATRTSHPHSARPSPPAGPRSTERYAEAFPRSTKVHVEGPRGVRVPMREIALSGGAPLTICEAEGVYGVSSGPDGTICITPQTPSGVACVSSSGGVLEPLTKLDLSK